MIDVVLKAETQEVADTVKMFLTTYKEQVVGFTNQVLSTQGQKVDAGLKVVDNTITVYQMNPDKGFVLGEVDALPPLELMDYQYLPEGQRYVTIEGDRVFLFIKEPQGTPDPKIGAFKTLNDAVIEFNSESVKTALKQYSEKKAAEEKARLKDEKRAIRLGKHVSVEATDASVEMSDEIGTIE